MPEPIRQGAEWERICQKAKKVNEGCNAQVFIISAVWILKILSPIYFFSFMMSLEAFISCLA